MADLEPKRPKPQSPATREEARKAARAWRRKLAERVVEDLKARDPALLENLTELGVVRREYLERPDGGPLSRAAPMDMVERLLERSVERKPSLLARFGLSALQILSTPTEDEDGMGAATSARLAIAFTDLEDFTTFTATEGDEAASRLLASHHKTVGPVVRSRGGKVVKRLGDGLLLTFPEPEAAVMACLELVDAQPEPLRLRAGVHVGDVLITRDDVIGHVVNVAARVTETARGGCVVATADVQRDAGGSLPRVAFGDARKETLKGIPEVVSVCDVTYTVASN